MPTLSAHWCRVSAVFCLFIPFLASPALSQSVLPQRSISNWVSCTGTEDDTSGAIAAFAAAKGNAFTLLVDCPVRLHSGVAVDRGIFIDSGTSVAFSGAGKFFVDNLFHPAFVIANSSGITLTNWNVEWDGSVPVDPDFHGYEISGRFVTVGGTTQPASAFNDLVLTSWLQSNRGIRFDESQGYIKAIWPASAAVAAVFFITGSSSNIVFTQLKLYAPPTAGGNEFMPMAFSMSSNWRSGQTVNANTPRIGRYVSVPQWLTFSGITLDGTLMGWNGNVQDSMFENITSGRYSDLQDADGQHVGGIGKWFPPPHLFYLNYGYSGDPLLYNSNIHIVGVLDAGPRIGVARDKGGSDPGSGYALSLKLGCYNCSVTNYGSMRPDGFMDLLASSQLTVSHVFAAFNSAFLNNIYPGGLRFPISGYSYVTFEDVQLVDQAISPIRPPIGNAYNSDNDGFVFQNVQVDLNRWTNSDSPLPTIAGVTNNVALNFLMTQQSKKLSHGQLGTVSANLQATPTNVTAGGSTLLDWSSSAATGCQGSGAWQGSLGTGGSRIIKLPTPGTYTFILTCENGSDSSPTSVVVAAH